MNKTKFAINKMVSLLQAVNEQLNFVDLIRVSGNEMTHTLNDETGYMETCSLVNYAVDLYIQRDVEDAVKDLKESKFKLEMALQTLIQCQDVVNRKL